MWPFPLKGFGKTIAQRHPCPLALYWSEKELPIHDISVGNSSLQPNYLLRTGKYLASCSNLTTSGPVFLYDYSFSISTILEWKKLSIHCNLSHHILILERREKLSNMIVKQSASYMIRGHYGCWLLELSEISESQGATKLAMTFSLLIVYIPLAPDVFSGIYRLIKLNSQISHFSLLWNPSSLCLLYSHWKFKRYRTLC